MTTLTEKITSAVNDTMRGYTVVEKPFYNSETSKCRDRLGKFCLGTGMDIGFGGDSINKTAMNMDLRRPYTELGDDPQHLWGHCADLHWFADGQLDYIYSSHLIEDFSYEEMIVILREWLRVLKPLGHLVLYQPTEAVYKAHCDATGQSHNPGHKNDDFSFEALHKKVLPSLDVDLIYHEDFDDEYSFDLVLRKR